MKTFIIIVVLIIGVLGYTGFVPIVSDIMGTNNPRNLGVEIMAEHGDRAQEKLSQSIVDPGDDPHQQLMDAGGVPVNATLTQEEFAAHLMKLHPVSEVQIKIEGNEFEISGRIDRERIPAFARTLGVDDGKSTSEILDIVDQYLLVSPVFYAKGSGSIENDVPRVDFSKTELGRVPVPTGEAAEALEQYLDLVLSNSPFSAEYIAVEDGELTFQGSASREVPRY